MCDGKNCEHWDTTMNGHFRGSQTYSTKFASQRYMCNLATRSGQKSDFKYWCYQPKSLAFLYAGDSIVQDLAIVEHRSVQSMIG